jgi:hypothetical protein
VDNGSLALPNYLVELAAFLPKQDREKAVEVLTNTGKETYLHSKFIGLVAALNIHEAKQYLKKELEGHTPSYRKNDPIYDADRYWRIRIALAQMGEREYIDHCIEALNFIYQADEDRFVRSRFLYYLDAISHIRQEETIAIIMRYCDDETVTSACIGQLAVVADASLHNLRASLYGFPLDDTAGDQLSPAQRTLCREWLKTAKDPISGPRIDES